MSEINLEEYACPCKYVEPCSVDCSCANPVMSGGCRRCCSHGSLEQRQEQAKILARIIDKGIKTINAKPINSETK